MAYEQDGIAYPSVTTILGQLDKPALTYWAANCAVDYIEEHIDKIQNPRGPHTIADILGGARTAFKSASTAAKSIGTEVHHMIEDYIRTGEDPSVSSDAAANAFLAFLEWESKNNVRWIASEITLYHRHIGYAGTADARAVINDHEYIVDFKTSKAVYDEYRVQLAAYKAAAEDSGIETPSIGIIRLDKESGAPEFLDVTAGCEERIRYFYLLVRAYYAAKKRRLKGNPWVRDFWGKK